MAVGFDTQLYYVPATGTSFSTSLLTVGAGANRALVVTTIESANVSASLTVTWNGVPLTLVSSTSVDDGTNSAFMRIWALINPAAGNFTLAGSWTGSASFVVGAVSYTGVDQTSVAVAFPHGATASGTSATAGVTISSASGNAVVALFASAPAGPFLSTSGTNIYIDSVSLVPYVAASRDIGAASVSMTAPLTGSGTWVAAGCDVLASVDVNTNLMAQIWM